QLAALRKDCPESVSAFKLETQLAIAKATDRPKAVADAETKIRQFVQSNPSDIAAKLLWAEWLMGTGRTADAVAYLNDPAHFAAANQDRRVQRLRTIAQLSLGDRNAGAVQQAAAKDPLVDLAVIQASATSDEKQRQVGEALARYEDNGLFRCAGA